MMYEAAIYMGYGTIRDRWGVWSKLTHTWIFPGRYGKLAAQRLARKLNNIEKS